MPRKKSLIVRKVYGFKLSPETFKLLVVYSLNRGMNRSAVIEELIVHECSKKGSVGGVL